MESILKTCSEDHLQLFSVDIPDVGGVAATLYVLNGGARPPTPMLGDFAYDFSSSTFHIYHKECWKNFTVSDIETTVKHPNGNLSTVSFTRGGLPFWMPRNLGEDTVPCRFCSVDVLLSHFRRTFDIGKLNVQKLPPIPTVVSPEERTESLKRKNRDGLQGGSKEGRPKRRRVILATSKDKRRFVTSSVGFPEDMDKIDWDGGFETHLPFSGNGCQEDEEGLTVSELSGRPSLERSGSGKCGPEPDSFRVRDLVVQLKLDPVLRGQGDHDEESLARALKTLIDEILSCLRESTSVVIRGGASTLGLKFNKVLLGLQLGSLGQRCQWLDGVLLAASRDCDEPCGVHRTTTLERFIDLVDDHTTCGNFLDSKDLNPSPPMWATPLLDSTTAWNHTMHLRFTQNTKKKKKQASEVVIEQGGPSAIRSATWTSQGWRLMTHPGYVTPPHHDCCGLGTYVIGNSGAKVWAILRTKRKLCPESLAQLPEAFQRTVGLSPEGKFPDADIATMCLEEGDVMFQPPGVIHAVYTPVPSVFSGGYFYNYETMHLTRAVLTLGSLEDEDSLTNDDRPGFLRTLCRMVIALRYREEKTSRKIGKRSFISLLLIVSERARSEKYRPDPKDNSALANEERGEMAFAVTCAQALLRWMGLTLSAAKEFVDSCGPYYSGGDEQVEIPGLLEGSIDPLFPDMGDVM